MANGGPTATKIASVTRLQLTCVILGRVYANAQLVGAVQHAIGSVHC